MKRYNITVNGKAYDVAVEEVGGSTAAAPVAAGPCCSRSCCSGSSRCTCCRWHKGNSSNAWYYP